MKYVPGAPLQIDVNAQVLYNKIVGFGFSYRTLNNLVVQINTYLGKNFRLGYGFNMGLGFRNNTQFTGHEVVLMYIGNRQKKKTGVSCPRF